MYIDTNILVALYVPEKLTQQANDLILNSEKRRISDINRIEFLSALNKKVRMGSFTNEQTAIVFGEFENHISQGLFNKIGIDSNHYQKGIQLLQQTDAALGTLDALHLGIAFTEGIEIASNDQTLLRAAKEFNIPTVEI